MKILLAAFACTVLCSCETAPGDETAFEPQYVAPPSSVMTPRNSLLDRGWAIGAHSALGDARTYMDAPEPNMQKLASPRTF